MRISAFFSRWDILIRDRGGSKPGSFFWVVEMSQLFLSIPEQNSRWEQTGKCYKTQPGCVCQGAESGTGIFSSPQGLSSPHSHRGFISAFSGLNILTQSGNDEC